MRTNYSLARDLLPLAFLIRESLADNTKEYGIKILYDAGDSLSGSARCLNLLELEFAPCDRLPKMTGSKGDALKL